MIRKDMHPARKVLRSVLLVFLGVSLGIFITIISLRVSYKDKQIRGPLQTKIFEIDIMQHQAAAYFADDAEDMAIAENLLKAGFFSPLYTEAGLKMLEDKAEMGYQPAVERLKPLQPYLARYKRK